MVNKIDMLMYAKKLIDTYSMEKKEARLSIKYMIENRRNLEGLSIALNGFTMLMDDKDRMELVRYIDKNRLTRNICRAINRVKKYAAA